MSLKFPIEYTLEDGIHVKVSQTGEGKYDFALRPDDGDESHFTYVDEGTKDEEWEKTLTFDQLNAVRRFWLEQETH